MQDLGHIVLLAEFVDGQAQAQGPGAFGKRRWRGLVAGHHRVAAQQRAGIARNTAHVRPESSMPPVDVSQPADKREPEVRS